jgi:hypothetical protein
MTFLNRETLPPLETSGVSIPRAKHEKLPSQMREEVPTGMGLVGAWDRWFREHRGLVRHWHDGYARRANNGTASG